MAVEVAASVSSGVAPLRVQFTLSGNDEAEEISWAFGDGLTSPERHPLHTFVMPGTYTVTVTGIARTNPCGTDFTATATITVSKEFAVYGLDICFAFGRGDDLQGYGPREYGGDYWVYPPLEIGGRMCRDSNGLARHILFDQNTGTFREVGRYEGPADTGMDECWTDDDQDGTGHEIAGYAEFGEDVAEQEQWEIEHLESALRLRPERDAKAYATGYDAYGYRSAQQVDLTLYKNGNTVAGECSDIDEGTQITLDRKTQMNRGRLRVDWAASEINIVEVVSEYKVLGGDPGPDKQLTTEKEHQQALGDVEFWFSRNADLLLDLASGVSVDGPVVTACSGPDSRTDSAMQFAAAINLGVRSLVGGSLLVWYQNLASIYIGNRLITLTTVGTIGSWTLGYASSISASGALIITPTGTGKVCDLRGYGDSLSAATRAYYLEDVDNNSGNNVMNP